MLEFGGGWCGGDVGVWNATVPSSSGCSYTIIVILVRNIPMSNGNLSSSITAFSLLPVMVKPSLFVAAAAVDEKTGRDLIVRETRHNAMIDYTTQRQ